ncbi:MAG: hypothetical protein IPO04_10970 [Cytophagaceae bacterium]|nr:hypothetical protein [Cytophagaceae bacterium]
MDNTTVPAEVPLVPAPAPETEATARLRFTPPGIAPDILAVIFRVTEGGTAEVKFNHLGLFVEVVVI